MIRVGHGYDVHRLIEGRSLILGGVDVPFEKGLLGHSDADVLLHAIMDSLLGAAALGDIGLHFPDNSEQYKDSSSMLLLKRVGELIKENGFTLNNIDATILAQAPRLRPYINEMRANISDVLILPIDNVSIKATTEEGLGFTGSKEGIAAHSVCLLESTTK